MMSLDTLPDIVATSVTVVLIAVATLAVLRLLVGDAAPGEAAAVTSPQLPADGDSVTPAAEELVVHSERERSELEAPGGGQGA